MTPEQNHGERADGHVDGSPPLSVQDKHHAIDAQQEPAQQQDHAYSTIDPCVPSGFTAVTEHIRRWRTWDRDDVEVLFSAVVAFAALVGVVGLIITSRLTLSALDESRKANEAASRAATAAEQQLRLTQETVRLEQRAFVYVSSVTLVREPTTNNPNAPVVIAITNRGKTPAHQLVNRTFATFDTGLPDWDQRRPSAPYVIPPGLDGLTITAYTVDEFAPPEYNSQIPRMVSEYIEGQRRLVVWTRLEYLDWYNRPHWVEVCAYRTYGMPTNTFVFCESGNDYDRDQ